jgi:hypothetical protein
VTLEPQLSSLMAVGDRVAIQEVLARYSTAVDARRWTLLDQVFTPGAIIDFQSSGGVRDEYPAITEYLKAALGGFAAIQHYFTNFLLEVEGATARGRFYCLTNIVTIVDGEDQVLENGGYYDATFVRGPHGWRISRMVATLTWLDGHWPEGVARPAWFGTSTDRFSSAPSS